MVMASMYAPTAPKLSFPNHKKQSSIPFTLRRPSLIPFPSSNSHSLCRCLNASASDDANSTSGGGGNNVRWDAMVQDFVSNAIKQFDSLISSLLKDDAAMAAVEGGGEKEKEWDWDRWRQHFEEVDEQERLLTVLKARLRDAVYLEDYEDAARLKVAIAAASTNDSVGRVMSYLNSAIKEERYTDAAFLRDEAGAGLAVYLKRRGGAFHGSPTTSPKALSASERLGSVESTDDRSELFVVSTEDPADDRNDGSDPAEGMPGFQNVMKDMIPGVKVKIFKVTHPEKVDKDIISKVIEQIIEEEEDEDNDEDDDEEEEEGEDEDEDEDEDEEQDNDTGSLELADVKSETDQEGDDEIEINDDLGTFEHEEQNEIAVKIVVRGLVQKLSSSFPTWDLLRVPAKLEMKGRGSFSFTVEKEVNQQDDHDKGKSLSDKSTRMQGPRKVDHVMFDLAKFIGKGKVPSKVLKEVGDLINLTLSQAQNHQPLSGTTTFNRIEIPASLDPLNGLYIGAHGPFSSEVIQLSRRVGQWQEESGSKEPSDLEFYEYVEALKLTGDPYVPAGQVAFRAKVGKRYQLPHKGIIPEEFGVVARYKGQGRLAEPGFKNPRWVDGELVILDGKHIKAGPVVGFVYWAPEYHFLVFFNRLRLQQ
nr:protein EXECUTER 1, chloroplastic isoform X2 [Arachis hypogaea]